MSAQLPASDLPRLPSNPSTWPQWLKEPLLHFLLLGAALFAGDHALNRRDDAERVIVVGREVDEEAIQTFSAARGRAPNPQELTALRRVWLDNEVLYREGLALQLDKGDTTIRERVIFKALSVVDSGVKPPPLDDKKLRAWFEQHRVKYDEPARFDFQEAQLAEDNSETAVRAFVQALNSGVPGDAKAGLRVFKGRPHSNLLQSYGADFAKALEESPVGQWRALQSQGVWRAVKLDAISAAKPAVFENVAPVVLQDWTDATMAEQRSAAVAALAKKYDIRYELPATPAPAASTAR